MPVMTAVTLMMSNYELSDDYKENDLPSCPPYLFKIVNDWLLSIDESPLRLLGNSNQSPIESPEQGERLDGFGGCLRPFLQIASGGYRNIFGLEGEREAAFREFVLTLPWRYPRVSYTDYYARRGSGCGPSSRS
jgi:hypothetical protein